MSKLLLYLMLLLFGIFVFLMTFKQMIVYPLLIPIILLVVLWYFVTFHVSKKKVLKIRKGEEFLFFRAQLIEETNSNVIHGALVVSSGVMVFYKRKDWKGNLEIIWSTFTPELESYELCTVDGKHKGIKLSVKGDLHPTLIASNGIYASEEAFKSMLGWES